VSPDSRNSSSNLKNPLCVSREIMFRLGTAHQIHISLKLYTSSSNAGAPFSSARWRSYWKDGSPSYPWLLLSFLSSDVLSSECKSACLIHLTQDSRSFLFVRTEVVMQPESYLERLNGVRDVGEHRGGGWRDPGFICVCDVVSHVSLPSGSARDCMRAAIHGSPRFLRSCRLQRSDDPCRTHRCASQ